MNDAIKKEQIIAEISNLEDEKLIWAIAHFLHLKEEGEIPN